MESSKYFAIITKNGKYPLCNNDGKILLFTPQQLGTAFGIDLFDIRDKLLPKPTAFSKIKENNNLFDKQEEPKQLNQPGNAKFIILNITDTNNIFIITEKKSIARKNPKTMKFGLLEDAENFVKKLNKRDNTQKYYITSYFKI